MKIAFKIFIIIFVIATIYNAKNELKYVASKMGLLAQSEVVDPAKNENSKDEASLQKETKGEIIAPGPLKVIRDLIGEDTILKSDIVIEETNKARALNGLNVKLIENERLSRSAEKKVDDMFQQQYFEHISPSGEKVDDLIKDEDYEFIIVGENLALGDFKNEADLVNAWMQSPPHKKNIMNTRYKEIGVSVKKGTFEGRTVWIGVQHFGLYIDECPKIDLELKSKIVSIQKDLEIENSKLEKLNKEISNMTDKESQQYKTKVEEYNNLVTKYNGEILATKKDINTFNKQVENFNKCAAGEVK
jgi:uncharacterized protein YkwD